mmetsp:Transcript_37873/g.99187  ORF Transcript_37873/g.99187 Transcript_37873/m.99187 type:complete len:105 (-) Transcript_37873:47-361(-)
MMFTSDPVQRDHACAHVATAFLAIANLALWAAGMETAWRFQRFRHGSARLIEERLPGEELRRYRTRLAHWWGVAGKGQVSWIVEHRDQQAGQLAGGVQQVCSLD